MIRSGRAAHETTLAGREGEPGTRHLYGEVICDALEDLQRAALESPRPNVLVKVDRSGLNEHHPDGAKAVCRDRAALRPIVAAEERRAGAHLVRPGRAVQARDQVGLRALNDVLKGAFDAPGGAGFERGVIRRTRRPASRRRRRGASRPSRRRPSRVRARPMSCWPRRCGSSSRRFVCIQERTAGCRFWSIRRRSLRGRRSR